MKNKRFKARELSVPVSIAVGAAVAVVLSVLQSAVVSYLVVNGQIAEEAIGTVIPILQFVSMFIGGLTASLVSTKKAGIVPAVLSAVYLLLLIGCHILFIDEKMIISMGTMIAAVAASLINLLLVLRGSKGKKMKLRSR